MTTLSNGLQVVFLEDHSTPIVHAEIWYHVGSKNERPGRTGFAHLFEHLMFKGSKNVEPEGHPSWISSVGGQSNAYTNEDSTVFWQTFPAQYLPLVLWLEADRLASLRIEEKVLQGARDRKESGGCVSRISLQAAERIVYDHAYRASMARTISGMKDLGSASIEAVRSSSAPTTCQQRTLVLVGDFDTKEATALVQQCSAGYPSQRRAAHIRRSRRRRRAAGPPRDN